MHGLDARFEWSDSFENALAKARGYAVRALELDPGDANANIASGLVALLDGRHDDAVASARRAVQLAPGSADVTQFAGFMLTPSAYPEQGAALIERAMTLSPNYPAMYLGVLGDAYRQAGRLEEAIAAFKAFHARSEGFGLTDLVMAYQENGQPEEARETAVRLMAARPGFTIAAWRKSQAMRRDKARIESDAEALRASGLPMN